MASTNLSSSELCSKCSVLTFEMFWQGFEHPLTYKQQIESGKRCKLCRLMVCTFSRLQVHANCYEVARNYEAYAPLLLSRKSVLRDDATARSESRPVLLMEKMVEPPLRLSWVRHGAFPGVCGSFGFMTDEPNYGARTTTGATVQISAPEDSVYLTNLYTSNREVLPANSSRNISLLYRWLHECIDNREHECCRKSLSGVSYDDDGGEHLPSRVIDVGALDGSEPAKLLITNGKKGRYTALSHRWGKSPKIKLTADKLNNFTQALPMNDLPLTFKDALQVTRNLGISYLWIDSLCIIQDDPLDWGYESAQMGPYFEKATCTIAAVDAIDDATNQDIGLFNQRETDQLSVAISCPFEDDEEEPPSIDDPCWDGQMERLIFSSTRPSTRVITLRPRWKGLWATISTSAWHNRAWVVQERMLSRRIIYYTKRKIFWECQKHSADEENMEVANSPLRSQFLDSLDRVTSANMPASPWEWFDGLQTWRYQISEYSGCGLTKGSDRLLAFHGLCDRLSNRLHRQIYIGVMIDGTGADLLWARKDEASAACFDFHAPSWSWMAYQGRITYSFRHLDGTCSSDLTQSRVDHLRLCQSQDECRTDRCGMLVFTTAVQRVIVAEFLDQWSTLDNNELVHVLGSAVHYEPESIPRADGATVDVQRRKLDFPPKVQVLRDRHTRRAIGWFIHDRATRHGEEQEILCANIITWQANKIPGIVTTMGRIKGFDYLSERNIDVIGLEIANDQPERYRRIGRGRVVTTGCYQHYPRKDFCLS